MARVPNTKSVKRGSPGRKAARSADTERAQAAIGAKAGKQPAGAAKRAATARPTRAVSKDELRIQVEKLERANATLRAKNREANRAAKLSAARIAELEDEVARLQAPLATTTDFRSAALSSERGSQVRDIDPGDAVPPGVAPEDPEPPDQEAETARENLEAHLRDQ